MNTHYRFYALLGMALCLLNSGITAVNAADSVPNYANAVIELEKKLYTGKNAIKVEKQDMAVMMKEGQELAKNMPNPGLKVGDKAPDFSLKNPYGKSIKLSKLLKKGPVILTFYRGAWCPYCNLQMQQLKASVPKFKKYGASILAVTPQKPDKSLEQFKKDGFPFDVVSDLDYKVIKAYKLYWQVSAELDAAYKHAFGLDVTAFNGKGRRGLPVPGTFVIDKNGIIREAFAGADYTKRMEPAAILSALKKLPKNYSKK